MIAPNVVRHCSLTGHSWVACHGGRSCSHCDYVELRRADVLPEVGPVAERMGVSDVAFYGSLIFLFASLVFATVAIIHLYA